MTVSLDARLRGHDEKESMIARGGFREVDDGVGERSKGVEGIPKGVLERFEVRMSE